MNLYTSRKIRSTRNAIHYLSYFGFDTRRRRRRISIRCLRAAMTGDVLLIYTRAQSVNTDRKRFLEKNQQNNRNKRQIYFVLPTGFVIL